MIPLERNTQPNEALAYRPDGVLDVVNVWYTLQGEGPYVGTPAIFVRLAGCNLKCPLCDTDYTSNRRLYTISQLLAWMIESEPKGRRPQLVVITGGEPFRQNLAPFVEAAWQRYEVIQIETNGTLAPAVFPYDSPHISIVCSPKTNKIHDRIKEYVMAYKYIIEHDHVDVVDGLPTSVLGDPVRPFRPPQLMVQTGRVFVQPADVKDTMETSLNMKAAVQSCLQHGHRLSLQLHKICGLD